MNKFNLVLPFLALLLCVTAGHAYDMEWTYLPPSATGNGGIYTSTSSREPALRFINPGALGLHALHTHLAFSFRPNPQIQSNNRLNREIRRAADILSFGIAPETLSRRTGLTIPLAAGLGFHRGVSAYDYVQEEFDERAHGVSAALGIDKGIRLGVGWNLHVGKWKWSDLRQEYVSSDVGAVAELPLLTLAGRISHRNAELSPGVRAELTPSAGLMWGNLGGRDFWERTSSGETSSNLQSRYARAHVSLCAAIYASDGERGEWQLLAIETGAQERESLSRYNRFVQGLGDIRFWNDLIAGKSNENLIRNKGWELALFEALVLRSGVVDYGFGDNQLCSGFGLRLSGLARIASHSSAMNGNGTALEYLIRHFDVRYDYAETHFEYNAGEDGRQSVGEVYQSISLILQ